MLTFRRVHLGILVACVGVMGCSKVDAPPLAKVSGELVQNGAPVPGALVEFHPSHGRRSAGVTDAKGRFQMMYTETIAGAIPGPHTVNFFLIPTTAPKLPGGLSEKEKEETYSRAMQPVRANYEETVDVQKGTNEFHFDLTAKLK